MNKLTLFVFTLVFVVVVPPAVPRTYTKCEFAQTLKVLGVHDVENWVCIAYWEAGPRPHIETNTINSAATYWYYGPFQISSQYWCDGRNTPTDRNACEIDCDSLLDEVTADEVNCIRKIHSRQGFNAWNDWRRSCKGNNLTIANCSLD